MRHKMQQQQTPLRQKASEDICCAQHPNFFANVFFATLELVLTLKGLTLMGNDATWATLLDYGGHTMKMAGLYPLSQFLLYQAVVDILC
jgi:hypothetical protein